MSLDGSFSSLFPRFSDVFFKASQLKTAGFTIRTNLNFKAL